MMVEVFRRWLIVTLLTWLRPKRLLFMFYTGGAVGGYIGWIEAKGFGTLAYVKPNGRYVYRW